MSSLSRTVVAIALFSTVRYATALGTHNNFLRGGSEVSDSPIASTVSVNEKQRVTSLESHLTDLTEAIGSVSWGNWALYGLFSWIAVTALGAFVGACLYTHKAPGMEQTVFGTPQEIMSRGYFGCLNDSETCVCALLCPAVRWADTVAMAGLINFWHAFLLFSLLMLLNGTSHTGFTMGIFTASVMLYFRQCIRKRLGMPFCTVSTCLPDALFTLLCPFCAISQEARAVGVATREGMLGSPVKAMDMATSVTLLSEDLSNTLFGSTQQVPKPSSRTALVPGQAPPVIGARPYQPVSASSVK